MADTSQPAGDGGQAAAASSSEDSRTQGVQARPFHCLASAILAFFDASHARPVWLLPCPADVALGVSGAAAEAYSLMIALSPTGLRPSVGIWPAESRVVPERWAGAREPLPAPAARLPASMPRVHCRRAARPPSLHPIGPEGASLSALSLPDSRPTLARAGVLLAAAASRRPPARHRPLPGTDKTGRRRRRGRRRRC